MKKNNIIKFPSVENRPNHIYDTKHCASCKKELNLDEVFAQVSMTSVDGMEKKHIALCSDCERIAEEYGVFND